MLFLWYHGMSRIKEHYETIGIIAMYHFVCGCHPGRWNVEMFAWYLPKPRYLIDSGQQVGGIVWKSCGVGSSDLWRVSSTNHAKSIKLPKTKNRMPAMAAFKGTTAIFKWETGAEIGYGEEVTSLPIGQAFRCFCRNLKYMGVEFVLSCPAKATHDPVIMASGDMLRFPKTEASVQKLLNLLKCDNCACALHMPFTTGVCPHTLCETCCNPSKQPKKGGGVCPVCKIPIRPCDVKPHPQLSSLVLISRRLAKLLLHPFDADFIDQTPTPQSKMPLKDNLDFLNSDTYCRVDSPSPSQESFNNLKTTSFERVLAVSPVACSIQAEPEPTVLLMPSDRAQADLVGAQAGRRSPSPAQTAVTPPSRTRRSVRRKLGDTSDSRASPKPPSRMLGIAKAPVAVPEDSYITEDSVISSARQKSTSTVDRIKSEAESTSFFVGKRANLQKAKSTGSAKTKPKRSTVIDSSSTLHLRLNSKGESVVHRAAIKNDVAHLETLLSSGLSANVRDHAGWTPLHEAALRGHTEVTLPSHY
ncbi:unnamed protein product [Schistocephalus solidus]|uniref:RING-type domain-containing protein n=1 Tax=Schistocephalus solidus TaxID=70667 RepID=A0A183TLT7_SCHSO|nr:unnamed protein product [Schistocephalus solidus]